MGNPFSRFFGQRPSTQSSWGDDLLVSRYRRSAAVLLEARALADGGSNVFLRQNVRGEPVVWCRLEDSLGVTMLRSPDTFYAAVSKTFREYLQEDWLKDAYERAKKRFPDLGWGVDRPIESLEFQYALDDDDDSVVVSIEEFFPSKAPDHDFFIVREAFRETFGSRMKKTTYSSAWEIE